jgi:acyl-coenzyme A thioesterase PaaI-like protein
VADATEPPEGFVPAPGRGAFSTHNGPYYYKPGDDELVEQAFFALPRHANGVGLIHGGMLSGFMDGVLAAAAGRATRMHAITMHLSIDFLHMGRVGDWIRGEARMTRGTRDVAFVEGRAYARGVDLVRGSGLFKLMERRP